VRFILNELRENIAEIVPNSIIDPV